MKHEGKVFFVSGIDTNIGKTYATGLIAKAIAERGHSVITQKMIQTGCTGSSEDIEKHRELQQIPMQEDDLSGLTCPYIFSYPCSPHMAAERDGCTIDYDIISRATQQLRRKYDYVLLEGAGGLMVPTDQERLTIDYIKAHRYPILLVTSGRLGSINHTLLNLSVCKSYGLEVTALIYNRYPREDEAIEQNTLEYLHKHYPKLPIILLPDTSQGDLPPEVQISELL